MSNGNNHFMAFQETAVVTVSPFFINYTAINCMNADK